MDYEKAWKSLKETVDLTLEGGKENHLNGMPFENASVQELSERIENKGLIRGMSFIRLEMDWLEKNPPTFK